MNRQNKLTKQDAVIILIITLIYAAIAFYNLGARHAPQTYIHLTPESDVSIDLGKNTEISSFKLYLGAREMSEEQYLSMTISDENGAEVYTSDMDYGTVFCWSEINDVNAVGRHITLSSSRNLYISELGIFGDGELISPVTFPSQLFDEQSLIPDNISYRNGTYFDEIYHARTGYEFVNRLHVYEWTHPPLGKLFISLGIKLFGMTPFGWRVVGTLFGIFMIPAIYIFLKKMFGTTWICVCGTLLFTFDFMHFAQTRIATIDVYVTFFIMLMYLFMYTFYALDFAAMPYKNVISPLIPCGIMTGFAISCKWTGIYAAVGLAILFFMAFARMRRENNDMFNKTCAKTIFLCVLLFGIVPVIIYTLSYIPFMRCNGGGLSAMLQNQVDMLTYHGKTVVNSTHAYSSPWYKWPIDCRPIWYYTGENGTRTENISSFGNPAVWWAGIAAFFYCLYDAIRSKNKNARFLVIAYLSQLVPWIPVTRITFIYHYFPCVPFIVLMICHTAYRTKRKKSLIGLTVLAIILFAAFYPVISGYPVPNDYVMHFLRWFPSWQLAR